MALQTKSKRINVTIPISLLEELKAFVPKRQRNQFIVSALAQEVRRLKLQNALQESSGSWTAQDYPELATGLDIETYVREMRAGYRPRSWDELAEAEPDA
ncbi:MAG: hypothetical protein GY796_05635 [Chloroflexi bacterium]|nr:hypothetical protein [Chloroflexota bacterium]